MTEKEFIAGWTARLASSGIKNFPADFISFDNYKEIRLPGKHLVIGEELFGTYEILTTEGEAVIQADSYQKAKFIIYSNRNTPFIIHLPERDEDIRNAVSKYEAYLDSILKDIEMDYIKSFSKEMTSGNVVTEIFKIINLIRV